MSNVLNSGGVHLNGRFVFLLKCWMIIIPVVMRKEWGLYSVSCIGMLPFIEGSLRDGTSGLVAVSHDSEEHA